MLSEILRTCTHNSFILHVGSQIYMCCTLYLLLTYKRRFNLMLNILSIFSWKCLEASIPEESEKKNKNKNCRKVRSHYKKACKNGYSVLAASFGAVLGPILFCIQVTNTRQVIRIAIWLAELILAIGPLNNKLQVISNYK